MKESTVPLLETLKNLMSPSQTAMGRFMCNSTPSTEDTKRRRSIRQNVAKSKSGIWGPTHSQDSEDQPEEGEDEHQDSSVGPQTPEAASPPDTSNEASKREQNASLMNIGVWNCTSAVIQDFLNPPCTPCNLCRGEERNTGSRQKNNRQKVSGGGVSHKSDKRTRSGLDSANGPLSQTIYLATKNSTTSSLTFGMIAPNTNPSTDAFSNAKLEESNLQQDLWQPPPPPTTPTPKSQKVTNSPIDHVVAKNIQSRERIREPPPFQQIKFDSNVEFSRNISELTMKSCLGLGPNVPGSLPSSRRMAYYAVGKQPSSKDTRGGNRRCYFTGALIYGGQPFYAGSVQQGSRTLVVFCLPKALGLPRRQDLERLAMVDQDQLMEIKTCTSNVSQKSKRSHKSFGGKTQASRYSSACSEDVAMDSFVTDNWEEDENGNVVETANAELLLLALPEPSQMLMEEMEKRYTEQFLTLPQQIRKHESWRLYMRFCFFSGLPIADGEMYYKVLDKVTSKLKKQLRRSGLNEIILSHEVMEAAHGCSSELINLPTRKTFRYLHEHYGQQCAKLNDRVFKRTNWQKVMPEV